MSNPRDHIGFSVTTDEEKRLSGEWVDGTHQLLIRVYYADTDFSGVVYHARYLEFLERGRTDFLRFLDIDHREQDVLYKSPFTWVIRRVEIDFRLPAHIDDILLIQTTLMKMSGARLFMRQSVLCDDDVLVHAIVQVAITDGNGRPQRFPKEWMRIFRFYV